MSPSLIAVPVSVDKSERIVIPNVPCDAAISVGDWVRISSSGEALKAQSDTPSNGKVSGVVEAKPSTTLANVLVSGISSGIFLALDQTAEYFLSATTPGTIETSQPSGSGNIVVSVGQPLTTTKLCVKIDKRTILS